MNRDMTIGFIGNPNCGKTTLFNILTGQMDYDDGEVYVNPNKRIETLLARHRAAQGEQGQMSMDFNNVNN